MAQSPMRVLYLGANLRMRLTEYTAPGLRALAIKQALEQAGIQFVTLMAGDQVDSQRAQAIYSNQLKRFLPRWITGNLRDLYEIYLDRSFYRVVEARLREVHPDIILQKHSRYGQVGVRLGRHYHIPVFLDDITPVWEGELFSDRGLKWIARSIRKNVFSAASGLIAVSPEMESQLQSEGVPANKIHFVPNGVDGDLFNPDTTSLEIRQKFGLDGKIVVGYVGGFQQWHRLDLLIEAAGLLAGDFPYLHFLLVGDDVNGEGERLVRQKGLSDHFTFPGGVPHSKIPLYLNSMDITILPSTLAYMAPMKIYEYMAMGKPVVAPNKNTLVESVVIHEQIGLLFEAGNSGSMSNAIRCLVVDPALRQKLGAEARKTALGKYTWQHQTGNLIQAFKAALPS